MAEEQSQTQPLIDPAKPQTEGLGNDPKARNPDGSLIDPAKVSQTEPKTEPVTDPKLAKEEPKKDEPKKEEPKKEAAKGVPEKYEPFKAPDGYTLNDDLIAKASPIFKELGLTQDAAQKLVTLYGEAAAKDSTAPFDTYQGMRDGWRKEVISSDLGDGKIGLKPEVSAVIGRAIDSLPAADAKAFREAMTMTGAGDNPAFIRAFHAIASRLGEGTLVTGSGPSKHGQTNSGRANTTPAQAMYPNLPSSAG